MKKREDRDRNLEINKKINVGFKISAASIIAAATYYGSQKLLDKRIRYNPSKLRYLQTGIPDWHTIAGVKVLGANEAEMPIRALYLNAVKGFEEQLFRIPSAFNIFNITSPKLFKNADFLFQTESQREHLIRFSDYYKKLTGVDPRALDLDNQTFRFLNNQLHLASRDAATGEWRNTRLLLKYANVNVTKFPVGESINNSRFWADYQSALGTRALRFSNVQKSLEAFSYGISGGNTIAQKYGRISHALGIDAFKAYMKVLDDPFASVAGALDRFAPQTPGAVYSTLTKGSELLDFFKLRNKFGLGGFKHLDDTLPGLVKRHLGYGLPRILLGLYGFKAVNRLIAESSLTEGTPLEGGITGVGARLYQQTALTLSHFSKFIGLTDLKKAQEELAPGSANIGAVMAFPLAGMIAGATLSGGTTLAQHFQKNVNPLIEKEALKPFKLGSFINQTIKNFDEKHGTTILDHVKDIFPEEATRLRRFATTGFLVGLAASIAFLPGALGAKRDPEELEDIFSGEQLVPIRKGRWWEGGLGPYEGERIEYFAPHWSVKAKLDARAKATYGAFYGKPIERLVNSLTDPYYLERDAAERGTRQYSVWGPGDLGLGVLGKVYKHSLGKLFKPPVHFYENEEQRKEIEKNDPYSFKAAFSEITAALTEATGLRGFAARILMSHATGSDTIIKPDSIFESSERINSLARQYWDANVGSGLGTTEAIRRLMNKRDSEIEYRQSPLEAFAMPKWLPEELRRGDPYGSLLGGEYRLPGEGLSTLYPELKGLDPNRYSDVWKLKILSDVAPYSKERFLYEGIVSQKAEEGRLNMYERQMVDQLRQQQEDKLKFSKEWFYEKPTNLVGQYWETISKLGRRLPTEALVPFAPIHKFVPSQDPIERYRDMEVLDNQYKLWQNPIRDYIVPTFNRTVDLLSGGDYVPDRFKTKNEIEVEFQRLQYIKNSKIDQAIKLQRDPTIKQELLDQKEKTIYDVNPYANMDKVLKYVPRQERPYFDAFAREMSESRRQEILQYSPEYLKPFYIAQWEKIDNNLPDSTTPIPQKETLQRVITQTHSNLDDPNLWNPELPLRAIKAKVVENHGMNIHDLNLWREDKQLADKLPSGVTVSIGTGANGIFELRNKMYNQALALGLTDIDINITNSGRAKNKFNTTVDMKPYVNQQIADKNY